MATRSLRRSIRPSAATLWPAGRGDASAPWPLAVPRHDSGSLSRPPAMSGRGHRARGRSRGRARARPRHGRRGAARVPASRRAPEDLAVGVDPGEPRRRGTDGRRVVPQGREQRERSVPITEREGQPQGRSARQGSRPSPDPFEGSARAPGAPATSVESAAAFDPAIAALSTTPPVPMDRRARPRRAGQRMRGARWTRAAHACARIAGGRRRRERAQRHHGSPPSQSLRSAQSRPWVPGTQPRSPEDSSERPVDLEGGEGELGLVRHHPVGVGEGPEDQIEGVSVPAFDQPPYGATPTGRCTIAKITAEITELGVRERL